MAAVELLFAAFVGGVFGASIGALNAFVFTGFVIVAGETLNAVRVNYGIALPNITQEVGFGVFLGPHVAFAGGAAAAAYAARKGYLEGDGYHPAKNITTGLGTRLDVLAIGGVFGVVGHVFAELSVVVGAPYDPVAAGVVVSALAHRALLGYSVVGDWGLGREDEVWLPHQSRLPGVLFLGGSVGVLAGYLAYITGSAFLGFGVSAATLVFMCAGVSRIPVTHHITLPASTAVVALTGTSSGYVPLEVAQDLSLSVVLIIGGGFGLIGAFTGEFAQRLLYSGAETHLDPPAASIFLSSSAIALLAILGIMPSAAWIPVP